ncbi:MAG: coproporphyrinogen III oxidase [Candidatus Schekmanbacteria bacterium]|nr:coproporphyrinogen III oxidase [Candidatus Schekmanbacteria bacterium]
MRTDYWYILALVLLPALFMGVMMTSVIVPQASAEGDERFEKLSPEQKAQAQRMLQFMSDMDKKYFGRAYEMNGNSQSESKEFKTENTDYDVKVTRGAVIEKMGQMVAVSKKVGPNSRIPGNFLWGRFYSIDIHPKTPLVGMLHVAMVIQFFDSGMSFVGGWVDVLPGTRIESDIDELKKTMDNVFAKYKVNPDYYRNLICKGDPDEIDRKWRRKPSCAGASFYGRPAFAETEKNFDLVSDAFVSFTDAYLGEVEKHKNSPYTQADIEAQDTMRKQWLLDQLFSDPYSSKLVPFEVWSMANVPPVIKF